VATPYWAAVRDLLEDWFADFWSSASPSKGRDLRNQVPHLDRGVVIDRDEVEDRADHSCGRRRQLSCSHLLMCERQDRGETGAVDECDLGHVEPHVAVRLEAS
jgi:hypothetical protein